MNSDYVKYHRSPKAKKERASRNRARALLKKKYGAARLKGKEVDHKDGNPLNNSKGNLRILTRSRNRKKQ